jgi:predicted RNase H-like nuclease (RuvC/YqgF family)
MWTNIWETLKLLVNYDERLTRVEKESRELRDEQKELFRQLIALTLKVERLAERENWRDEMLRREIELERAKAESERAKAESERAKAEAERLRAELNRLALCRRLPLTQKTIKPELSVPKPHQP